MIQARTAFKSGHGESLGRGGGKKEHISQSIGKLTPGRSIFHFGALPLDSPQGGVIKQHTIHGDARFVCLPHQGQGRRGLERVAIVVVVVVVVT